jgi:tetratricopeptide (TPR) repeat protein
MSPEQAAGEIETVGPTTDVYGLGAILFTQLTGEPPVEGESPGEILDRVRQGAIRSPRALNPKIPRALEAVCLKALALQAQDRYPTALALAEEIEHWLADEPVRAYAEPWWGRLARWVRRHRAWMQAGAATLGFVTVVAVLAMLLINGERVRADQRRREADEQRRLAEARRQEADEQRGLAEANLATARAAVDGYLTKVASDQLLKTPGMQSLRRDLLGSALVFYRDFLRQREDDPGLRRVLAEVHLRVGQIHAELGDGQAQASFTAARDLYRALAEERPDDREALLGLADCQLALGQPAVAVALLEPLQRAAPGDVRARSRLADAYQALASEVAAAGRPVDAVEAYRKARPCGRHRRELGQTSRRPASSSPRRSTTSASA